MQGQSVEKSMGEVDSTDRNFLRDENRIATCARRTPVDEKVTEENFRIPPRRKTKPVCDRQYAFARRFVLQHRKEEQSANVTLHGRDNSFHPAEEARWRWPVLDGVIVVVMI